MMYLKMFIGFGNKIDKNQGGIRCAMKCRDRNDSAGKLSIFFRALTQTCRAHLSYGNIFER